MLGGIGIFFAERFRRWLPDSYIFALILTLIAAVWAFFAVDVGPMKIAEAWYKGFWILLEFAMQMVLILVTGYAIALSPIASRFIDWLVVPLLVGLGPRIAAFDRLKAARRKGPRRIRVSALRDSASLRFGFLLR